MNSLTVVKLDENTDESEISLQIVKIADESLTVGFVDVELVSNGGGFTEIVRVFENDIEVGVADVDVSLNGRITITLDNPRSVEQVAVVRSFDKQLLSTSGAICSGGVIVVPPVPA